MRGLLHVHTTFSDGELTPAQVRDALRADGFRFACLTDHAEMLTADSLAAYVDICTRLSDQSFLLLPGLEFACDGGLHILGFGCVSLAPSAEPTAVIEHIRRAGGVAVVAHPRPGQETVIERLIGQLDGIEAWNTKADGRLAPRPGTISLVERLCTGDSGPFAFYGVDWHWRRQYRRLSTQIQVTEANASAVLGALKAGRFSGLHGAVTLPAFGPPPAAWRRRAERLHRWESGFRRVIDHGRRWLRQSGFPIPASLKAQLRRFQ